MGDRRNSVWGEFIREEWRLGRGNARGEDLHIDDNDRRDDRADSKGRKISRRCPMGAEIISLDGEDGEDWESVSAMEWFFAMKVYIVPHILISPFGIYEIMTCINMARRDNKMELGGGVS